MPKVKDIQSHEKQGPTAKIALSSKAIIQNQRADKKIPRLKKKKTTLKKFIITKPLLYEMLKGLKKKQIKTMNNKMAINTYLSTTESKNQTKETRTETKSWIQRAF